MAEDIDIKRKTTKVTIPLWGKYIRSIRAITNEIYCNNLAIKSAHFLNVLSWKTIFGITLYFEIIISIFLMLKR